MNDKIKYAQLRKVLTVHLYIVNTKSAVVRVAKS